jgi:predicted nucleic acid-binding protein
MPDAVALGTTFITGLIDEKDVWHSSAHALLPLLDTGVQVLVVFDCVMVEVVSILARRTHEKRRTAELSALLARLRADFPARALTWLYADLAERYDEVVAMVEQSNGELNFNDALIALACRERRIDYLASFDADFDQIRWLKRIAQPSDIRQ